MSLTQLKDLKQNYLASHLLEQEAQAAQQFAAAQHAPATIRAYLSDSRIFMQWCEARNLSALPALAGTVAVFMATQAEQKVKPNTLSRRIAAIRYLHNLNGYELPTNSEIVKATLKGIKRTLGIAPQQKAPATAERLREMLRYIPNNLQGARDRALLLLGVAGALRRSELAALTLADIAATEQGWRLRIRHSKTDQEKQGHTIAIYRGTKLRVIEAVQNWLTVANIDTGYIFRSLIKGGKVAHTALSTKSIAQIVKKCRISGI
jgi:site-specific recombinase XerD